MGAVRRAEVVLGAQLSVEVDLPAETFVRKGSPVQVRIFRGRLF